MAGIPIVDGGTGPGGTGASGASGASGGGTGPGVSSLPVWKSTPVAAPTGPTTATLTFQVPTVASGAALSYLVEVRARYGFWEDATVSGPTGSGSTKTFQVSGLTAKTTYSFRITASTTVAGITRSVPTEVSNTITTPGTIVGPAGATGASGASGPIAASGKAASGPAYTAPTAKYRVRGYTDEEEQERPTVAGNFGVVGDSLSDLHSRTEDNIREALNWQLTNAGGWFNASAAICGMIAQNPFIAGMQQFVEWLGRETGTILGDILAGIGALADWLKGVLCCDPAVVGTTPIMILDAIHGFFDAVMSNPLVAAFVTWSENIGTSVGNFFFDLLDGAGKLFQVICSLLTTGQLPEFMDGWTPGDNPLEEILNSFVDIIVAFCNNPITGGLAGLVDSTGRIFVDAVMGAIEFMTQIAEALGLDDAPQAIISWIRTTLECWWGILGGVGEFIGQGIIGLITLASEIFTNIVNLFGGPETVQGMVDWATEQLACWWEALGGVGSFIGNGIVGFFSLVGDVIGGFTSLLGTLAAQTAPVITEFFQNAIDFLWNAISFLMNPFGFVEQDGKTVENLITAFWTWIGKIPLIGPLLLKITGQDIDELGGPDPLTAALDAIGNFFAPASTLVNNFVNLAVQNVTNAITGGVASLEAFFGGITSGSILGEIQRFFSIDNLVGLIKQAIGFFLPTIPIGAVGDKEVNLLQLGEFKTIGTLEASSGWSWDSTQNRSGTTGGSAKVNCSTSSGTRQLYSNQNIAVVPGDKIGVSAWVKTSGYNGSGTSIQIGIVTFAGTTQKTTVLLGSRGASNGSWGEVTNRSSLWTVPQAANPADQITSVQVTLAVGATATAGTVNWDDLSLWKGGLMQQGLVEYLINSWNSLIGGLSTNSTGGTPPAASTTDPWNSLLGAGAAARQQANSALANAATADGKAVGAQGTADGANNRLTDTNNGLFGQDSFTAGTKLDEGVFPPTVGAVGSGVIMKREGLYPYAVGIRSGYDFSYLPRDFFTSTPIDTGDLEYDPTNPYATFKAKNSGWYLIELGFALNFTKQYTYWWSFTPVIYETRTFMAKYGSTVVSPRDTNLGLSYTFSPGFAQSSFICYMNPGDRVYAAYNARKENTTSGTDELVGVSSGGMTYFSAALLNRSLA